MRKNKIIILILGGMISLYWSVLFAQNQKEIKTKEFNVTAKVLSVEAVPTDSPKLHLYNYDEVLRRKNDSVLLVGVDSSWAVKMKIISVEGKNNILKIGETITFIIHSPIKLFACSSEEAIGKTFPLKLGMIQYEDKTVSFNLFLNYNKLITNQ